MHSSMACHKPFGVNVEQRKQALCDLGHCPVLSNKCQRQVSLPFLFWTLCFALATQAEVIMSVKAP